MRKQALLWLALAFPFAPIVQAAPPLVQISPTLYQTEHCLFVIDATVTWATPATAYNDIYGYSGDPLNPFPRLNGYFDSLLAQFPDTYFTVCYIANTGDSHVPNYIDRTFKATGINETYGVGPPNTFATVDICRYNLSGGVVSASLLAVFDHELGHAWGARAFYNTPPTPSLSNGHWLPHSTVDCQMSATYSTDSYVTLSKLYGDPAGGFHWQKVDNLRSNDYEVYSEQTLYLMGVRKTWPTAYVLNNAVYNADTTAGYSSVDTFDHAGMVAAYGPRNPDYTTAQKRFKVGFVYIARDLAEVNTVYQAVEQSVDQFCNAETIDRQVFRFQIPFLCDAKFAASVTGLLSDLDGNASPTLAVTDTYVQSTDGTAVVNFVANDPDGAAPTMSVLAASTTCSIVGSTVQIAGLPDGTHFFTLKAVDSGGKKTFGHFVVEVQRPASSTALTSQPAEQTVTAGNPASFSVTATGSPASFTYQWFRQAVRESTWNSLGDGGAYGGCTTATLTVASTPAMSGDAFLCVVSNATGTATSSAATLVVNETVPALTTQPIDRSVSNGTVVFLTVAAGGTTDFGYYYYQWQRLPAGGGVWADQGNVGAYSGATTASLRIVSSLAMSGDQFRCLVSNTAGAVTSNTVTLTVGTGPSITTQPVSPVTVSAGQTASFSVVVGGTAPFAYQWSRYGVPVAGATGATLTLANAQAADAGAYTVAVTNAFGSTNSNVGSLTVTPAAPVFLAQPQSAAATVGQNVSFTIAVTGTSPFTYQWRKNGANISGATSAALSLANAQLADAADYTVVVTNSVGSATSSVATLTVTTPPPGQVPADFNNDGQPDILWRNNVTGAIALWLMNGTTSQSALVIGSSPLAWDVSGIGDFNGDGQTDLLWRHPTSGAVAFWLMNGTTQQSAVVIANVPIDWAIFGTGDFNNDGKIDILWRKPSTGDVAYWLMNGTALQSVVVTANVPTDWTICGTGDFNSDGKVDILWRKPSTGDVAFWLMNGTALQSVVVTANVPTDWTISGTGDFNGDGKVDILWQNYTTGGVAFWLMNGTAMQSAVVIGNIPADWLICN